MSPITNRVTFTLNHTDTETSARAGTLITRSSTAKTPIFMPVATHGVVRGQRLTDLAQLDFPILLANTYHLLLRPGCETFKQFGGIRNFINWPKSVLTDSGGFQLFSLAKSIKVNEDGAIFTSYIDGKKVHLSPETSIAAQRALNSDIMMVLDQCLPSLSAREPMREAMSRTYRWAKRSLVAREDSDQALFGIVQGGCFLDLRKESAEEITSIPLDGYAIGGVAVGEDKSIRDDIVEYTAPLLPPHSPRYLMGVGTPIDLLEGVARGIDMFDCILPNALAEHGKAFTYGGRINLLRSVYNRSDEPIDKECGCTTCTNHSRGYLHQLLKALEPSAKSLIGMHNLYFYQNLMQRMRGEIVNGTFGSFYRMHKQTLALQDPEHPVVTPKPRKREQKRARGDYEIHVHNGHSSIRQISSGEIMHSVSDPYDEAVRLYVEQPRLHERIFEDPTLPCTIWDVGLGSATNAMAAILRYEEVVRSQPDAQRECSSLTIQSFENDLDPLALTLKNPAFFPHVRHPAPYTLLKEGVWRSPDGKITCQFHRGEFLTVLPNLQRTTTPDLIYYDPFSYKTNPTLWTWDVFKELFTFSVENKTTLLTYSASTAIRAALLAAGYRVALGAPSGPKESTTVATRGTRAEFLEKYLDDSWITKWERSENPYPPLLSSEQREEFRQSLKNSFSLIQKHRNNN